MYCYPQIGDLNMVYTGLQKPALILQFLSIAEIPSSNCSSDTFTIIVCRIDSVMYAASGTFINGRAPAFLSPEACGNVKVQKKRAGGNFESNRTRRWSRMAFISHIRRQRVLPEGQPTSIVKGRASNRDGRK
jgi:hypothetical protein